MYEMVWGVDVILAAVKCKVLLDRDSDMTLVRRSIECGLERRRERSMEGRDDGRWGTGHWMFADKQMEVE